jgi:hypothetical protein
MVTAEEGVTVPLVGVTLSNVCDVMAVKLVVVLQVSWKVWAGGADCPKDCVKLSRVTEVVQEGVGLVTFIVYGMRSGVDPELKPPLTITFPVTF